jgi:AbrB family looped-hinge helix DNA binding protein
VTLEAGSTYGDVFRFVSWNPGNGGASISIHFGMESFFCVFPSEEFAYLFALFVGKCFNAFLICIFRSEVYNVYIDLIDNEREVCMVIAKVNSGQITIPARIREKLGIKDGDKIMFLEEGNNVTLVNSSLLAIEQLQREMKGEAEKAGIACEADVVELCKDVRRELYRERYARNN